MSISLTTHLGAVIAGECPEPYEESWDTFDAVNLPMTGFTCQAKWKVDGGAQVVRAGSVNAATSTTTIVWQASDHAAAGLMAGEVIVTDGTSTYKRGFARVVLSPRGGA